MQQICYTSIQVHKIEFLLYRVEIHVIYGNGYLRILMNKTLGICKINLYDTGANLVRHIR